jgi:hypothetical protein
MGSAAPQFASIEADCVHRLGLDMLTGNDGVRKAGLTVESHDGSHVTSDVAR